MYFLKKYFIVGCFIFTFDVIAQVISYNQNSWFHYVGKAVISKKITAGFEGTFRFTDYVKSKQQWFVRPFFDYNLNKNVTFSLGYTHYNTFSYGQPAMFKTTIPEDHVWIQSTFYQQVKAVKVTHRLRNENRFVGIPAIQPNGYAISTYDYRNRLRYLLQVQLKIFRASESCNIYTIFGNEIFINIGKFSGATVLNQNRIIAGLGIQIAPNHNFQLAYIHQHIWNFSNTIIESNPTLRLSYLQSIDIRKSN